MTNGIMPANPTKVIIIVSKIHIRFLENISIAVKTIVKANNIHAHSDGLNGNAFLHVCFSAIT